MKKLITVTLAAMVLLLSCHMTESLDLDGNSSAHLQVEDFFITVLEDFSEFVPSGDDTIMDSAVLSFRDNLSWSGAARDIAYEKIDDNTYSVSFSFDDITSLIANLGAGGSQNLLVSDGHSLKLHVGMDNYDQLVRVIPFLEDPNFEPFGPVYNEGMTPDEYYEMMSFMLGEEAPEKISGSKIIIDIRTPAPIKTFSNGEKIFRDTFRYSFDLIDFLILEKPLEFTITW